MSELTPTAIWALVIGMAVVNFAERFIPLAVVSRMALPKPVLRWLSFVPIAVMGALVAPQLLTPNGEWVSPVSSPWLWAGIVTAVTYHLTRSFLGSTVAGMAAFVILRALLGA